MDSDPIGILSDHRSKALSHILRSIFCKGETEDIRRKVIGRLQNICYTGREELSLSTSWSGDHKYWSVDRLDGFELSSIERREDIYEFFFHNEILGKNKRKSNKKVKRCIDIDNLIILNIILSILTVHYKSYL